MRLRAITALLVGILAAGIAVAAAPAAALECSTVDPIRLYGSEAYFEVRRDQSPIGHHRIRFTRRGGTLLVAAEFSVAVTFLGIPVYSYDYRSREIWQGGCLQSVEAKINDDGKQWDVAAHGRDGAMKVSGPAGSFVVDRPVFPTNHWNADVVRTSAVLNTLTGKIDEVQIRRVGTESVPTGTGPRSATHYRYTGELDTDIWYDSAGRWVKMRFPGKDGSVIDYICRRCGPPQSTARNG